MNRLASFLLPRLQDVLFISLLAAVIIYGPRLFNEDGDLGRHITVGEYILSRGRIPLTDLFSHTRQGAPLVPHEWLAQVLFALAHRGLGLSGDVLLTAIVVAGTFLLTFREIIQRGINRIVGLAVVLFAAAASSLHWLARPHVFTFLLLALWSYQLARLSDDRSHRIWPFALLMLVWANIHGAFIAAFVILAVHIVDWVAEFQQGRATLEKGKRLILIGLTSLLASFLNPAGWRLWNTSVGYVSNSYLVGHTVEYLPPDFHNFGTWPFLMMVIFALFALAWGKRLRPREAMLLAIWAAMGLYSARNIPLFAIVTAPAFAELIQAQIGARPWMLRQESLLGHIDGQLHGFLWPALAVMVAVLVLRQSVPIDPARRGNQFDPRMFPVTAVNWMELHPQKGNGFNYFTWGGYLLYRLWPGQRVFIDGQTDFYGEALTREYETIIMMGPGWKDILKKYDVAWAIIPANLPLVAGMEEANWMNIYQDDTAVILRSPQQ